MRIDIVVYTGFDDLDVFGPLEVLRNAERDGADFSTRLVTRAEDHCVASAYGVQLQADATYSPGADLLLVPGGGWGAHLTDGAWGEVQRGDWLPLLREAAHSGTIMAGVCTGVMLLAHAGVIGSRRANTHHTAQDELAATGATVVDDRVVDEGDLITAGGVTSGIDLALWIVERYANPQLAESGAQRMEYVRARPTVPNT